MCERATPDGPSQASSRLVAVGPATRASDPRRGRADATEVIFSIRPRVNHYRYSSVGPRPRASFYGCSTFGRNIAAARCHLPLPLC